MNAIRESIGQDVRSGNITATGTAVSGPARVKGIWYRGTAAAQSVVLRDGGGGGAVKLTLDGLAVADVRYLELPEGGMVFATDVHATLTNVDSLTVIYR
jgi:hypothetical protein